MDGPAKQARPLKYKGRPLPAIGGAPATLHSIDTQMHTHVCGTVTVTSVPRRKTAQEAAAQSSSTSSHNEREGMRARADVHMGQVALRVLGKNERVGRA